MLNTSCNILLLCTFSDFYVNVIVFHSNDVRVPTLDSLLSIADNKVDDLSTLDSSLPFL